MSREKKRIKLGVLHVEDRKNVISDVREIFDKKVADLEKNYPGVADIDFVLHSVLMKHENGEAINDNDYDAIQQKVLDSLGVFSSQNCKLAAIILDFLFGQEDLPNGQAYKDMKLETTGGFKLLQIIDEKLAGDENKIFLVTFSRFVSNEQDLRKLFSSFFRNVCLLEWRNPDNSEADKLETALGTLLKAIYRKHKDIQTDYLTRSKKGQEILKQVRKASSGDSTVLIQGKSGTGKELLAKSIHFNSFRRKKPFISVNCSALAENLLESELFGHEKGAFTGAVKMKKGRFELADKGTLFFDEIGDLSHNRQVKLLRVLQEKSFERVGGVKPVSVNIRIIAATNKNLKNEVESGRFREDLYYRLNIINIYPPSLREQRENIPWLTEKLTIKINQKLEQFTRPIQINEEVMHIFTQYRWPGNVRELENAIEVMIGKAESPKLTTELIPQNIKDSVDESTKSNGSSENDVEDGSEEVWAVFKKDPELYGKFFEYQQYATAVHKAVNKGLPMKIIMKNYFNGMNPKPFYNKLRKMFGHNDRFPNKEKSNSGGVIEFFKHHTRKELMEIVVQGLKGGSEQKREERKDTT